MKPIDRPANRGIKKAAILDLDIFTLVLTRNPTISDLSSFYPFARSSKIDLNMFKHVQAVSGSTPGSATISKDPKRENLNKSDEVQVTWLCKKRLKRRDRSGSRRPSSHHTLPAKQHEIEMREVLL